MRRDTLHPAHVASEGGRGSPSSKKACDKVLGDLQSLVDKYERLGTQSKRTWDRIKWGNEDVAEIRARLTSTIALLTAYINTSQMSVETKLDKFIEEFRQGSKESSIISLQTIGSLSADDRVVWRKIRKQLEEIGIDLAAFEANRDFIFIWLKRAVETGAFDEQIPHDIVEQNKDSKLSEPWDSLEIDVSSGLSISDSSKPAKALDSKMASGKQVPKKPVHRGAALLAAISRPNQRFHKAVLNNEVSKALKILQNEASFQLLNTRIVDWALRFSCCHGYDGLIPGLIARGADVNSRVVRTPLWYGTAHESLNVVRLLVENGADVNYMGKGIQSILYDFDQKGGCSFAPRAAFERDSIAVLRLLLSYGANVHARYEHGSDGHKTHAQQI